MNIAFKYRDRVSGDDWSSVGSHSLLELKEGKSYLLKFKQPVNSGIAKELSAIGCEQLDTALYALRVINFAGEFTLAKVQVQIQPSKFTASSMSLMLEEISEMSASLVFGWGAPTLFQAQVSTTAHNPPPYHQLQFLRRSMLRAEIGERLQDYLEIIEHNPAKEFDRNRKPVPLSRVKHLDSRAIQKLVSHPAKMAQIEQHSPLYGSVLAKSLAFGLPPCQHLPIEVWQPSKQLSYDTLENRFVKRVIQECTDLVNRFVAHKKLHLSMRNDCQQMLSILTTMSKSPFLSGIRDLQNFSAPSQALLKAEGYRGVFTFWMQLIQHRSLPLDAAETVDLLEGKNLALLYEYWVFMQVVSAVALALGTTHAQKVSTSRDELGERLNHSYCVCFGENVSVKFNQSFTHSQGTSYSTSLRPDVVLSVAGSDYVFDAKYKMSKVSIVGEDEDEGLDGIYKRADLYKMHTYRDAIHNVRAAFVVYPGSDSIIFASDGKKLDIGPEIGPVDGVGAIALQPGKDRYDLQCILSGLLKSKG